MVLEAPTELMRLNAWGRTGCLGSFREMDDGISHNKVGGAAGTGLPIRPSSGREQSPFSSLELSPLKVCFSFLCRATL